MKKNKTFLTLPEEGHEGALAPDTLDNAGGSGKVSGLERWLVRLMLKVMCNPPLAIVLWNGEHISTSAEKPIAKAHIRDRRALFKLLVHPDLNFGDLYSLGRIKVDGELSAFLETTYKAFASSDKVEFLRRYVSRFINKPRRNSLSGSRNHISHHYDLGNEFYNLWLDRNHQQYTCAYYPHSNMTLEDAQEAKLEHICRKLQLKPGETVVEAGCGWGGLARYMAKHYGVKVRSYNISRQQILFARERAKTEGLDHLVEYVEDDYRNITGTYDVFVSVGMLEHVGHKHFHGLGEIMHRCLHEEGRGLIHSIGRNKPILMNAWIEKRIFPGAYPPSIGEMMNIFEPREFSILDVENLRMHYARTLEHWLERFESHAEKIEEMYDANFVRAWRLYLAGSIAAFTSGSLQLFQVLFARPRKNELPWSREHLYIKTDQNCFKLDKR